MNHSLPVLSIWKARSTYAVLLSILFTLLNALGVKVPADLDVEPLLDAIMALLPIFTVIWAWLERRSPHFKLVFGKPHAPDS